MAPYEPGISDRPRIGIREFIAHEGREEEAFEVTNTTRVVLSRAEVQRALKFWLLHTLVPASDAPTPKDMDKVSVTLTSGAAALDYEPLFSHQDPSSDA